VSTGVARYTMGVPELIDGLEVAVIATGIFGFAEIIRNHEAPLQRSILSTKISSLWLTGEQAKEAAPAVLRGTLVGSLLGVLPGGGAVLSSFASYAIEKRLSRHPERFGRGAIEGVAGPESANNAGAQTSFISMLTLGIPATSTMALMVGAMTVHNIQPGPQIMSKQPELFWGLIASMLIGNVLLVVLNLPLIGLWVRLLKVPYRLLFPAILLCASIGLYSVQSSTFDIIAALSFGVLGYILGKLHCEPAPFVLGF
jgi:putative tricarboxylic transport membrane protein